MYYIWALQKAGRLVARMCVRCLLVVYMAAVLQRIDLLRRPGAQDSREMAQFSYEASSSLTCQEIYSKIKHCLGR